MNPLTKVKLINELNEREVQLGVADKVSWHSEYKDSAWIFLGGLPYELTEGDIICVFSQYGEVVNINLVRDKKTGKSKGFCFLCYEDQRSTILAVDNFNGIKIKGRTIRVDHVSNYRAPKDSEDMDEVTRELHEKGCGAKTPPPSSSEGSEDDKPTKKHKKDKKEKKKKKKDKEKNDREVQAEQPSSSSSPRSKMRKEKDDPGSKKNSSWDSEMIRKPEYKERQKHHLGSLEVRASCRSGAEDPGREPKREKHKHEHKSSEHKSSEHKSSEHKSSEHKSSERKSSEHKSSEHKSSEHKSSEHKSSEHKSSEHKSSEHKSSEHKSSEHKSSEHKSSGRKEAREDKNRDWDSGRSSNTYSSWRSGHYEGRSRRSRSRSRDKSHRHKKVRERESSSSTDRRHH